MSDPLEGLPLELQDLYIKLQDDVYDGLKDEVVAGTVEALEKWQQTPGDVLDRGLVAGMEIVGEDFRDGSLFVPEVLLAAKAMKGAMEILRPLLTDAKDATRQGTVVIGTVKGDIHDIGKNLCNVMLEGAGFKVIDLGVNVAPEKFIEAIRTHQPEAVGMSAFLTTTMPMQKVTITAIEEAGLRDKVKILVGGAPVTQEFAEKIGADGYAPDANSTVRLTKKLIGLTA